jgi:hypothetical protein
MICYDQYTQLSENTKSWREKKKEKLNERKKCFKPSPFRNMTNGYQEHNSHINAPSVQGSKLVNLGFNK